MPSDSASAKPRSAALRVCELVTLIAGYAYPPVLAASIISAYWSGVANAMKAPWYETYDSWASLANCPAVLADPTVHGNTRGSARIYGPGRTVLRDRQRGFGGPVNLFGEPGAFLTEDHHAGRWEVKRLDRDRVWKEVDAEDR